MNDLERYDHWPDTEVDIWREVVLYVGGCRKEIRFEREGEREGMRERERKGRGLNPHS